MLCINISYKVPAAKAAEVEDPLIAHGKHMDHIYPSGNPDGMNPAEAYFTKSEEFNDPTDPSKGKTGNIIFNLRLTINLLDLLVLKNLVLLQLLRACSRIGAP